MVFHVVSGRFLHCLLSCLGKFGFCRGGFWAWVVAPLLLLSVGSLGGQTKDGKVASAGMTAFEARQAMHKEEAWLNVAAHLPDPATATGDQLETAGDVLRARRFTQDALEYYQDALRRGGNETRVMNKMGITELELRHPEMARAYFKLVVKKDKKNADGWNNLGAAEYMTGQSANSISAYRKAIKLRPAYAVFHVNLATAYVEHKMFEDARAEFGRAYDLDPELGMHKGDTAGISARILSADDHARFCFEVARMYAAKGKIEEMLHQLASAAEAGMDIKDAMLRDSLMSKYLKDPQVTLLIQNGKALRKTALAGLSVPVLPTPPDAQAAPAAH